MAKRGRPRHVVTANAEIIMLASTDDELARIIDRADLVTGDGAGVVWAASLLGDTLPERVTGIDLAEALFAWSGSGGAGFRFFFLGAKPGVAEAAAKAIQTRFPRVRVAGWRHGYFGLGSSEERSVIDAVKSAGPDVLLVAMGAPRQEKWIAANLRELGAQVAIGVGGSFDVWAGVARRAPGWVQTLNLEWAYRLAKEPARMKRAGALPRFMLATLAARVRGRENG